MTSSHTCKSLGRLLAIASAALLIQVGTAGAADQRPDIQAQMQDVLTGSIPVHAAGNGVTHRHDASRSSADFQAFARQLLQGWSVSPGARPAAAQPQRQVASGPAKSQDIQATVRRQLLGA